MIRVLVDLATLSPRLKRWSESHFTIVAEASNNPPIPLKPPLKAIYIYRAHAKLTFTRLKRRGIWKGT
ncbi:MAG: hypothetical protein QXN40_08375 [Candidatus Bathyarchaeia archaeon]